MDDNYNPSTVSELIQFLQSIYEEEGDLEVFIDDRNGWLKFPLIIDSIYKEPGKIIL